jgi:hypothetical protein
METPSSQAVNGAPVGASERPIRRAEIGRGVNAAAESARIAGNRGPDVSVLAAAQTYTVQEVLARVLASGIRQEEAAEKTNALLTRIAVALESAPQNGKPRGA